MLNTRPGYDHPTGAVVVKRINCDVKFDVYIPKNMERFPFYMLIMRGTHAHHPPYPDRLSRFVIEDIRAAIQASDLLRITTGTLDIC